ncbi:LacI family DNA-binding transcriptional regulator [Pantoea sp. GD03673]|uniref:LacI family DNA-binding transcriptional regulator n=1 Tax=Pantoea sp. GD03673 TaxID=2975364 RepID=UPI00244D26FA|nr:LacI family DNA-binding transcriptional regulator [Pantoea sp. GD03673]MDH2069259.1 LacI family DNA-binding transcriptional regulator [Pantoea sp. GD03673]
MSLKEVARRAGVGLATVDRVLNERGGVAPETVHRVLQAAREVGLNRILPEEHRHPWQIELLLSSNDSFFFQQLAQDFTEIASNLGYRRLTLHRTFVPEAQPERLARLIRQGGERDGLIVFAHEHPAIYEALDHCKTRGVPVISLVTDLPGAARLCHVGIDQMQAGRTAAQLLGKMVHQPGEVLMVSGHQDYSAHRQRIEGFRDLITRRFPHLQLRDVLAAQENRDALSKLLEKQLVKSGNLRGIYNTGLGNTEIGQALARHRQLNQCVWITHELYATTRTLMAQQSVALTLDQNTRQHAQLAVQLMLNYLEQKVQPDEYASGKVDFMIYTAENLT